MSKHRSKSREDNNTSNNNNFMGLNPQMLQMLGINPNEVERISNIMNSMNRDGFDINSLGNLLNQNSNPQVGQNDFSNVTNNMNNNSNENNMDFSYFLNMLNNMKTITIMPQIITVKLLTTQIIQQTISQVQMVLIIVIKIKMSSMMI